MSRRAVFALILGALGVGALALTRVPAFAHFVPSPCDFVTSGGFVFEDDPATEARDNFGAHGGCKQNGPDAPFWGHVNYVDHNGFTPPQLNLTVPYHVNSTSITGYLCDPAFPNARDVCGFARTNAGETVRFRVRLVDNGEGTNAVCKDEFGIRLDNGYLVSTRKLAAGGPGGGNVQLHKDNPSTAAPTGGDELCGGLGSPGDPVQQNQNCPVNPEAQTNCPVGGPPPPA
jgi:hypothetical protein